MASQENTPTSWPAQRAEGFRVARMLGVLLLVLVGLGIATVSWAGAAHGADKVTICHHDNGKPGWKQITISTDALSAHMAHQWGADLYPVPAGGCPGATPEPSWTPTPIPSATASTQAPSSSPSATSTSEASPTPAPSSSESTPRPTTSASTETPTTSPSPSTPAAEPSSTPPAPNGTTTSPTASTATSTPSASATPIAVVLDAADTPAQLAETGMDLGAPTWIALGLIATGGLAIFAAAEHQVKRGRL